MFVLAPTPVTENIMSGSNLPETDAPAWGSGTAYVTGDTVIVTTTTLAKPSREAWTEGQSIYWNATVNAATNVVIGSAYIGLAAAPASRGATTGDVAAHAVYEATAASTGLNPVSNAALAATDPSRKWIRVGATNRYRPFDRSISDPASNASDITYTLTLDSLVTGVAFFGLVAASVTVEVQDGMGATVATQTVTLTDTSGIVDWYTFFTWNPVGAGISYQGEILFAGLTAYAGYSLLITIAGTDVEVGEIVVGQIIQLGTTLAGTEVGFDDYSGKERDDFGNVKLIEREYSDWASFSFSVYKPDVMRIKRTVASLRATPAVWYGSESSIVYGAMIYGFPAGGLRVPLEGADWSIASLEIEGLT